MPNIHMCKKNNAEWEKKQDVKYQVYASTSMFKYILMYIDKGKESLE